MGRLFWKFFFFFWLAQMVTSAGVGVAIWAEHADQRGAVFERPSGPPPLNFPGFERRPPPGSLIASPRLPLPLIPILAGSVVSLFFAALLAWYFAKPIRSLRSAFESVANGELGTRIGKTMSARKDELADLGSDFDRMAIRLENLIGAQRRLLHDVSHELRSPLARLQASADLVRQQPERTSEFIDRIERDTTRMNTLVGELLTMARLDAGITGRLDDLVDLREVLTDIADDARFEVERKNCSIEIEMEGPSVVRASHELLYRAIENIVRNAIRYSPAHARIAISSNAKDGVLHLSVADNGPGVVEADLETIFDPFVRSGSDRSADGYGLGLAIARRVIEAHGGSVGAANRPEGGLVIMMKLLQGQDTSLHN